MKPAPLAALTPAMAKLLQRIGRVERPAFHQLTPPQARQTYEAAAEVLEPSRAPLARVQAAAAQAVAATALAKALER